jgi:Uma2 family endonuclease
MANAERLSPISVENYLSGEQRARLKHEYVAGMIYAMAGGTYAHNLVASNVLGELHAQLKGKPCRALNSDSKVRIQSGTQTRFYYPDASVVCGENVLDGMFQDKPTVVIEVLSETTRRTDEGEKFEAYQKIPTLNVYIVLEQDIVGVIVYRRTGTLFQREVYSDLSAIVPLPEIDAELRLASVYDEVNFVAETETTTWNSTEQQAGHE